MTAPTETGMMKVFHAQQGLVEQLVADNSALSLALQKFVDGMRAVAGKDQYDQKWLAEAEEALNKHGNGPEYQGWRNKIYCFDPMEDAIAVYEALIRPFKECQE